ncbi:hypothetical protein [Parvularcula oceani]|uniref:hypothetical protein n=1 Tax=Parvularcula oceani TaxID=1247963 RepID=UPI00068C6AFB|nr:hypothetical protein [Parvularcula oceani]
MIGSNNAMLDIAQALASHAAEAQRVAAHNIAQADTPGFKARSVEAFAAAYAAGREAPRVGVDRTAAADPNGNTVSVEAQVLALADARGQHDLGLAIWDKTLGLYKAALGRIR